jgi:hypothetical protein
MSDAVNVLAILLIASNLLWLAALTIVDRQADTAVDGWRRTLTALKRANDQAASLALENDRLYKLLDAKERP